MLQTVYYDPFRVFAPESRVAKNAKKTQADKEGYWRPDVDIVESSDQYQLLLDLPGIDPQQIEITEEKNILSIKADRARVETGEEQHLTRVERKTGVYQRQFTLPDDADVDAIKAESNNGVLSLTISRKQPQETIRKIEVTR